MISSHINTRVEDSVRIAARVSEKSSAEDSLMFLSRK